MTLRLRLVMAIVVLVAGGLALFGAATYTFYANSEYQRLDQQIRSSEPLVSQQLAQAAGLSDGPFQGFGAGGGPPNSPDRGAPPGAPIAVPPGTYAELRDRSGDVLSHVQLTSGALPKLPTVLPAATPEGKLFNVGTTSGGGGYRVLVVAGRDGTTQVIALPTTEVTRALHKLLLIESVGAALLLVVLSIGSWLILRRGLRPLERMARKARSITAGDLSQRVTPSGGPTEVGELGLALNTMLGDIETAFAEREATELRLRQFLADASHELRTPLTSIQGFAELFRVSGEDARVDLPTILRRIEEESARMKVLVEDLLLLARLDQTRAGERASVDLAVLAADACSDAVATDPDRAVTLDAPEPVVVAGDEAHLRQAVANLVTNAVRHTPEGSPIEVSARRHDGVAVVAVRDHGAGLDELAVAHVFDRFWQADKARAGTGAGLGLAIVSSIATEHGGRATAANAPGGGAVFTIQLPLTPPALRPPTPRPEAAASGPEAVATADAVASEGIRRPV
ncbi:MAG TPA: HAMP domain-containing sensor histidine kinase [Acidimicrobiales bacterium]|jgi:two-component system OmpR family sensor kinase